MTKNSGDNFNNKVIRRRKFTPKDKLNSGNLSNGIQTTLSTTNATFESLQKLADHFNSCRY